MAFLNDLIEQIDNPELKERIADELKRLMHQKKFGLVFEEHLPECTPLWEVPVKRHATVARKDGKMDELWRVLKVANGKAVCIKEETLSQEGGGQEAVEFEVADLVTVAKFGEPIYPCLKPLDAISRAPEDDLWHVLIEADNYHALQFLEYIYGGKVDCIYIDPPYNTGAKDWKYNNDYVDDNDAYRHSKWLSMMQKRLKLAKKLLNPNDSVLIVTIDEKEYHHLACLLEQMFPEARIQMVTSVINPSGKVGGNFSDVAEFLFFICFGEASIDKNTEDMLFAGGQETDTGLAWESLLRRGSSWSPQTRPNLFYPILIDRETNRIVGVGEPADSTKTLPNIIDGKFAAYPIKSDGSYGIWRLAGNSVVRLAKLGYAYVTAYDERRNTYSMKYLMSGDLSRIESGEILVERTGTNGEVEIKSDYRKKKTPKTVWNVSSHNAGTNGGTVLLNNMIGRNLFSFPKSRYAVHDTLRFFVANKPKALIVDFFAGSGTTLHAVNLLNAADGGQRRCVMVTNNEVSEAEARALKADGHKPGDPAWERLGIARHVTWPRTVCSIEGHDVDGEPLNGNYGVEIDDFEIDEENVAVSRATSQPTRNKIYKKTKRQMYPELAEMRMADGFKANAAFFKLGFLDKNSVTLGRQFLEMLPTLWMKAGAHGPCPKIKTSAKEIQDSNSYLLFTANHFAVLFAESGFRAFQEALKGQNGITTVFLITDHEPSFKKMARALRGKTAYQLYRDYLDNFRINNEER